MIETVEQLGALLSRLATPIVFAIACFFFYDVDDD